MNPTFTLAFSAEELNLVLNALGQRPYVEVFNLITSIQQQATAQAQAQPAQGGKLEGVAEKRAAK